MLAEYDKYFPGWGARLLELTEKQGVHRQALEAKQVDRAERRMDRGQIFGFVVSALSLVVGAATLMVAQPSWPVAVATICFALAGVGGPAVARIIALKFRWPPFSGKQLETDKKNPASKSEA